MANSTKLSDLPVLRAYRDGIQLVAWCPYCKQFHRHGAGDARGEGDGHRIAHCVDNSSPFRDGGYVIKELSIEQMIEVRNALNDALLHYNLLKETKVSNKTRTRNGKH